MKALRLTGVHVGASLVFAALTFSDGISQHMSEADAETWAPILAENEITAEVIDLTAAPPAATSAPPALPPSVDDPDAGDGG